MKAWVTKYTYFVCNSKLQSYMCTSLYQLNSSRNRFAYFSSSQTSTFCLPHSEKFRETEGHQEILKLREFVKMCLFFLFGAESSKKNIYFSFHCIEALLPMHRFGFWLSTNKSTQIQYTSFFYRVVEIVLLSIGENYKLKQHECQLIKPNLT